jgi:hypothetical protein
LRLDIDPSSTKPIAPYIHAHDARMKAGTGWDKVKMGLFRKLTYC